MSNLTREILYTLRDDEGQTLETLKIAVGALSMLDSARYQVFLREGREWAEGAGLADGDPMLTQRRWLGLNRAQMLAATKAVAVPDGADGWKPGELPEAWRSVEGFVTEVPARLYTAWHEVAIDCNPGLFMAGLGDEEKNAVSVSVLS